MSAAWLDWSDSSHWGGGQTKPCRICRTPAFLRDEQGQPCHKSCAQVEADERPREELPESARAPRRRR